MAASFLFCLQKAVFYVIIFEENKIYKFVKANSGLNNRNELIRAVQYLPGCYQSTTVPLPLGGRSLANFRESDIYE